MPFRGYLRVYSFVMRHVIEAQQFERGDLDLLFKNADSLEASPRSPLAGKILATLFFEPSTRTRLSFESAMIRLGGSVIATENAKEASASKKGESLEDTIRVVSNYADVIVLRHSEIGSAERAAKVSGVPIINAGDGAGQHPTQALLDLYTIKRERGSIDGTRIAMVGDLKNGRTIRSLSYLLGKYEDIKIDFVSDGQLRIGNDVKEYLRERGISFAEQESLDGVLDTADVVYQSRIQKERFLTEEEYEKHTGKFMLNAANTEIMKPGAVIMHPLPRLDEIDPDLDELPRAAYFRQAKYGVLARMALLEHICS